MKTTLCTLHNFYYLDKGLALYESLTRVAGDFVLYVLAMDDDCFAFLQGCGYEKLVPIRLSDFENDELRAAKQNRSFGEYCWTCSASLIKYVLDHYGEPACAYIDADMFFYADPAVLFSELEERGASVLLPGHRFSRYEKYREAREGRFCVEFNLFRNDAPARRLLDTWIAQCLAACSSDADSGAFGDQQYLSGWADEHACVIETRHLGAGVAPWNVAQYRLVSHDPAKERYRLSVGGQETDLVFFHFAGLTYLSRTMADIGVYSYWGIDDRFVRPLYWNYLQVLEHYKQLVFDRTGREVLLKSHPAFEREKQTLAGRVKALAGRLFAPHGLSHFFRVEVPQKLLRKKNHIGL